MFDIPKKRYRHVTTGGVYEIVTRAKQEKDGTEVVIYKALVDGSIWSRPASEFDDGRFVDCTNGLYSVDENRLDSALSVVVYKFLIALDRFRQLERRGTWTGAYVSTEQERKESAATMQQARENLEYELVRSQVK